MSVNQSPIKIQLEESIWLDHRAEQAEIVSLELVPQLDLVEEEDHVNIKGNLMLMGRFELVDEEEESLNLESSSLAEQLQFDPLHVQQKELYQEEFRGKIEHPFPFEMSVPRKRIKDLDQLFVSIEQFDYIVTDGHRLSIKADVAISGIEANANEQLVEVQEDGDEGEFVQVEDQKEVEHREQGLPMIEVEAMRDDLLQVRAEEKSTEQVQASNAGEDVAVKGEEEPDRVENEEDKVKALEGEGESSLAFESEAEHNEEEQEIEPLQERPPEISPVKHQEIIMNFKSAPTESELLIEEIETDVQEEEEKVESRVSKTTSYLTQLMEQGDDERQFARLRMCIIQDDETLESIAKRYSISVQDIMRTNRLESERTSKGQIIYIP